jgi:hypothetical protein
MRSRKQFVALVASLMIFAWPLVRRANYGQLFHDTEFDTALAWAQQAGFDDIELTKEYPFSMITRAQATQWYVALAQQLELVPMQWLVCKFPDVADYPLKQQQLIELVCGYGFFQGHQGLYYPDEYISKANAVTALVRGLYPGVEFERTTPYRTPYMQQAKQLGITKQASSPYLSYLITRYELVLLLHRAYVAFAK